MGGRQSHLPRGCPFDHGRDQRAVRHAWLPFNPASIDMSRWGKTVRGELEWPVQLASSASVDVPLQEGGPWIVAINGVPKARVSSDVADVLKAVDGDMQPAQIAQLLGPVWTPADVEGIVRQLAHTGIFDDGAGPAETRRVQFRPPFTVQFTLFNPAPLLESFRPVVAAMMRPAGAVAALLLLLSGLIGVVFRGAQHVACPLNATSFGGLFVRGGSDVRVHPAARTGSWHGAHLLWRHTAADRDHAVLPFAGLLLRRYRWVALEFRKAAGARRPCRTLGARCPREHCHDGSGVSPGLATEGRRRALRDDLLRRGGAESLSLHQIGRLRSFDVRRGPSPPPEEVDG